MNFTFNVLTSRGERISISTLGPENTVLDIKTKVEEHEGIPVNMIMLVYKGNKLQDNDVIGQLGIEAGMTISMVLALRAG